MDVPNLLGKDAGIDSTANKIVPEASPTVTAPLAQVEAYEEQLQQQQQQMQQSAVSTVNSAVPPKENGQVGLTTFERVILTLCRA